MTLLTLSLHSHWLGGHRISEVNNFADSVSIVNNYTGTHFSRISLLKRKNSCSYEA